MPQSVWNFDNCKIVSRCDKPNLFMAIKCFEVFIVCCFCKAQNPRQNDWIMAVANVLAAVPKWVDWIIFTSASVTFYQVTNELYYFYYCGKKCT